MARVVQWPEEEKTPVSGTVQVPAMPVPCTPGGGGPVGVGGFTRLLSLDFDESADQDIAATGTASVSYTDADGAQAPVNVTVTKVSGANLRIGAAYGGWQINGAGQWTLPILTGGFGVDLSAYSRILAIVEMTSRQAGGTQTIQFGNTATPAYALLLLDATGPPGNGYVRADGDGLGYNQSRTKPGIGLTAGARFAMLLGPKAGVHILGVDASPLTDNPPTFATVAPSGGPSVDWGSYGTETDLFDGATDYFSTYADWGTAILIPKVHIFAPTDEVA